MSRNVKTVVALTAGALALSLMGVAPAVSAEQPAHSQPAAQAAAWGNNGHVVSRISLNIRSKPTTHSPVVGSLRSGSYIKLRCKVNGQNINGNRIWYELSHKLGWVPARYVKNLRHIHWCAH
ncbi:SH3 domain-containing protein [Streptomyces sp. H27-D2]|uniref:SH3 domain-containing protein n=1 Tax=Streptomyces sp. H27-D2 TaxID=3046304 RepID=UPI002DBC8430|nr:SH3 domain-containing protein [Streptomyces sp. H27-D2]MEC4019427.1 SH3 domain-containing protein [Streptomyces sp. H27-D2]